MKGLARDRKKMYSNPILCSSCGVRGGTLVKIDDHYEHQDKRKCWIMSYTRKPNV